MVAGAQGKVWISCPSENKILKQVHLDSYKKYGLNPFIRCNIYSKLEEEEERKNKTIPPNLIMGTKCIVCKKDMFIEQSFIQGESMKKWFDRCFNTTTTSTSTSSESVCGNEYENEVLCVLIQVIGTIWWLYQHHLYHNDISLENIILAPWPKGISSYTYTICDQTFFLSNQDSPCAYFIDYELMTENYPLNADRTKQTDLVTPWLDVCQFLHYFFLYPKLENFYSLIHAFCVPSEESKLFSSTKREAWARGLNSPRSNFCKDTEDLDSFAIQLKKAYDFMQSTDEEDQEEET